jgi:DNA repair exonuclease SbcCD nuclease subunit
MKEPSAVQRSVSLVHSSDLHVDDDIRPGCYNGLIGLQAVLATAAALAADVVLLAGDTFDNPRVSRAVLAEAASLLAATRLPVVILPGNHDPALPDCLYRRAGIIGLPQVHVLGVTHSASVVFAEHDLEIFGRAHVDYTDMSPLPRPLMRAARWQVIMAHGHHVPPEEWSRQSHRAWKISDDDIAKSGADYIALGHWDRATAVGDGAVPAYYSGSPDLAGTVNLIRLTANRVAVTRESLLWPR